MSARRGWCPTADRPMPSGDGLLARVRPRAATLRPAQARALDEAATRWGNGIIELTGRGNLQCRGFSAARFPAFLAAVRDAGLVDPDPVAEGRLRVIAAPMLDETALLERLEAALRLEASLDRLGAKFAIRVDGGTPGIEAVAADLAIDRGSVTLAGWRAPATDPVAAAIACCRAIAARDHARAREIDQPAALLAAISLKAAPVAAPAPPRTIGGFAWGIGIAPRFGQLGPGELAAPAPARTIGGFAWGIGVAPRFGQLGPGELAALAALAGATLRITPFRSILLPGAGPAALEAAAARNFVVRPDDPRLRIRACIGAPGCLSGEAPARAVAEDFLALVPAHGILHLSGCAKGCAHPEPAARTFIGRGGVLEEQAA